MIQMVILCIYIYIYIYIYIQFSDAVVLNKNNRLDETDSESVQFNEILELIRGGKMNDYYREILVRTCSRFKTGQWEFERRRFNDDGLLVIPVMTRGQITIMITRS